MQTLQEHHPLQEFAELEEGEIVSGVTRVVFMLDGCVHCEPLSSAWDHLPRYVLASDYDRLEREGDGLAGNLRTALLDRAAAESERDELRAELAALKAGQGEAVAIAECREVHGHMCQFLNRTQHGMDTLRDGDKLYTAPPASADAVSVPVEPTPAMVEAGVNEVVAPIATAGRKVVAVFKAMLAAAQSANSEQAACTHCNDSQWRTIIDEDGVSRDEKCPCLPTKKE